MTSFVLKIIAIISMLCDHIGIVFFGAGTPLTLIGRISFPIFAFQITQGYIHTKDIKNYILRLFIFACISQLPFYLFNNIYSNEITLNIFFTLLLGIIAILAYDKIKNNIFSFSIIFFLCVLSELAHTDYGAYGVTCIFLFYLFSKFIIDEENSKSKVLLYKLFMCISFIILTTIKYSLYWFKYPSLSEIYFKFFTFICLSLIPITLYNGKQGPRLKYLFYIFYPLHLIMIWAIHTYL